MTRPLLLLRRFAACAVAVAVCSASVAAQTPAPAPPVDAPASTRLLNAAAFARLTRKAFAAAPAAEAQDPPRAGLLRQSTAAGIGQARAASMPSSRPSSGGWGRKTAAVVTVVGLIAGVLAASIYTGVDFTPLLDALFGGR